VVKTVKELSDGMQAKLYLAKNQQGQDVCVKVFRPELDISKMNSAEVEFRIS
jgi:serine/threonine-protein kinase RIO1